MLIIRPTRGTAHALCAAVLLAFVAARPAIADAPRTCLVVGVSDGDTITTRCGSPGAYAQVRVRVAAIDAPERKQPFGQRAKQSLSDLCYRKEVWLTPRDWDRYGRMVASVSCQGQDAGRHQVRTGMAWVYDRYARGFERLYIDQSQARAARIGLWGDRSPVPPWEWRKAKRERRIPTAVDAGVVPLAP